MRVTWALTLLTIAGPIGAQGLDQFDDAEALVVPPPEREADAGEGSLSMGVRAATSRFSPDHGSAEPTVVARVALSLRMTSFGRRPLYWGRYTRARLAAGLGYGYELGADYEVGALLTTDAHGNGFFFLVGGGFDAASMGRTPFARGFAGLPLGYVVRSRDLAGELAVLPSAGAVSAGMPQVLLHPQPWLRERARLRAWSMALEVEHGQAWWPATDRYWEASLCAGAGSVPLVSCSSLRVVGQPSAPSSSATEVSVSFGFGGVYAITPSES